MKGNDVNVLTAIAPERNPSLSRKKIFNVNKKIKVLMQY